MTYAVLLSGVGPRRAFAQRVTHVVYLAHLSDDRVQLQPFADMASRLAERGVHHVVTAHDGVDYVSVNVPFLPRDYVAPVSARPIGACLFPIEGATTIDDARTALVAWCARYAA